MVWLRTLPRGWSITQPRPLSGGGRDGCPEPQPSPGLDPKARPPRQPLERCPGRGRRPPAPSSGRGYRVHPLCSSSSGKCSLDTFDPLTLWMFCRARGGMHRASTREMAVLGKVQKQEWPAQHSERRTGGRNAAARPQGPVGGPVHAAGTCDSRSLRGPGPPRSVSLLRCPTHRGGSQMPSSGPAGLEQQRPSLPARALAHIPLLGQPLLSPRSLPLSASLAPQPVASAPIACALLPGTWAPAPPCPPSSPGGSFAQTTCFSGTPPSPTPEPAASWKKSLPGTLEALDNWSQVLPPSCPCQPP